MELFDQHEIDFLYANVKNIESGEFLDNLFDQEGFDNLENDKDIFLKSEDITSKPIQIPSISEVIAPSLDEISHLGKTKSIQPKIINRNNKINPSKLKKAYGCICENSYPSVWKIKLDMFVRICLKCNKGIFITNCSKYLACSSCQKNTNKKSICKTSLKFRDDSFKRYFLDNANKNGDINVEIFLNVHVFQNIFDKYISNKKSNKREREIFENDFLFINKNNIIPEFEIATSFIQTLSTESLIKDAFQSRIEENINLLPFTWNELKNMKYQS